MDAAVSLIPELEDVVAHGTRQKRALMLRRVTTLFTRDASRYNADHVNLFDAVFGLLIAEIETKARAELSRSLAPIENAPPNVLRILACDDEIAVAGPVLRLAHRLAESDLVDLARTKSQAHLQAISARQALSEAITDVLVRRGDREVARKVAENRGARLSEMGFSRLVKRAESDGILAEKVGLRPDIPPRLFRELLAKATAVVRQRLLAAAQPERQAEIRRVLDKVAEEVGRRVGPRDYRAAQRIVLGLHRSGRMNEAALAAFANDGKYEETIAGLAALSKVPLKITDRLMSSERTDPALILCKAAGMSWPTVKAVITICANANRGASQNLDAAFVNYGRLSDATAQRVVRFWQVKQNA